MRKNQKKPVFPFSRGMVVNVYTDERKRDEASVEKIGTTKDGLTYMKTVSQRYDHGLIVFYVLLPGKSPSGNGWRESQWILKYSKNFVTHEPAYWFAPLG